MRRLLFTLCILCYYSTAGWSQTPGQRLVWEDNFDGPTLNPAHWTYERGDGCANGVCGWGNQELQTYTSRPENVRVENGKLIIEARRENRDGKQFTSGRIKSADRVAITYGTLEARIKVPKLDNGLWPAFWMLGANGTWPQSGEVDILEMGFAQAIKEGRVLNTVSSATHWYTQNPGGYTGHASYAKDYVNATNLNDDFHTYKLVWDKQFIRIFLDNTEYYTINIEGGNGLDAFQKPFYVLFNLAVGGNYPGISTPEGITAPLPGRMEVDYIRLYQSPGDELTLAKNTAPDGDYGIYTETTPVKEKVTYGQDANLYIWNNLQPITSPVPAPAEGKEVLAFRAAANNWFGLGVAAAPNKQLIYFAEGQLKFKMKTSSNAPFKVGVASTAGEVWIPFAGGEEYGLVRDGEWHQVSIPMSKFAGLDLYSITQLFMLAGDAPAANVDLYLDDIYYSGGVSPNPAPSVSILSPVNEAQLTTPLDLSITTRAQDANGSVTKVDFFDNRTYLGTVTQAPFTYTWTNVPAGVHTLVAKVTDDGEVTKSSAPVTIYVASANNMPPQITITSPAPTSELMKPATVVIQANATDTDGTINKVEFYNGTTLLGTATSAPYIYTWTDVDQGSYTITAKAYDNGNLSTISAPVTFSVADNLITATRFGVYTEDATITSKLRYGQNADLYYWNNLTPIPGAAAQEGAELIAVRAEANNWFGMGVAIKPLNLSRFNAGALKFHVKTTYKGQFKVGLATSAGEAWLDFAAGVQKNGLVRDGNWHQVVIPLASLSGIDLRAMTQAFMFAGDASPAAAEFYFDNIYFTQDGTGLTPPAVALTAPGVSQSFTAPATVLLEASATDTDGIISQVEFYNGATLLGTATQAPYQWSWTGVAAGTFTLTAQATDNTGLISRSAPVTITVAPDPNGPGLNLALRKPAEASSTEAPGTPASAAVDGNIGSRWSSSPADPQWLLVDLGKSYRIKQVKLTWEAAYGRDYEVQLSTNRTDWQTLKAVTGNQVLVNDHTGLNATGRYVRIYGTKRGTPYGYSIFELEVYGSELAPNVPAPITANSQLCQGSPSPVLSVTATGALKWYLAAMGGDQLSSTPAPATDKVGSTTYYVSQTVEGVESARSALTVEVLPRPVVTLLTRNGQNAVSADLNGAPVSLLAGGCSGTISWSSSSGETGTGNSISVPTSQPGPLVYQAICQEGSCLSAPATATVTVNVRLSVLHRDVDNYADNNSIQPLIVLQNQGAGSLPLSKLTLRYYLTVEGAAALSNLSINYAQLGNANVRLRYVPLSPVQTGAAGYVEYSFGAGAGSLAPSGSSGPIQAYFAKGDYSGLGELDDYSYALVRNQLVGNLRITAYYNGVLVAGLEPGSAAQIRALRALTESKNGPSATQINTYLTLRNEGNVAVNYSDLKARYYFTSDGPERLQVEVDEGTVQTQLVALNPAVGGANYYLEIRFLQAGQLAPGAAAGRVRYRISKPDGGRFDQTNDYSYQEQPAESSANNRLVTYVGEERVWGQEPGAGARQAAAPEPGTELTVRLLANPVTEQQVRMVISGAQGQPLQVSLHDLRGRPLSQRQVEVAGALEELTLDMGNTAPGVLLLRVSSPTQTRTLKVLKAQ